MGNAFNKTSNEVLYDRNYDYYQELLKDLKNNKFDASIETPINSIFKHLIIRFSFENEKLEIIKIIESNSFNMSSFKKIEYKPYYGKNYFAFALCLWYK